MENLDQRYLWLQLAKNDISALNSKINIHNNGKQRLLEPFPIKKN